MDSGRSGGPQTRPGLAADLRALGMRAGATVLVHASLRSLGWVLGGAPTVVRALLDVVGPGGTLVVPAFTPDNRDPSRWRHRAVPQAWWPAIREHLPPFDPATSQCLEMGRVAETVRTWPGAVRSGHPQTSFAAVGARAPEVTARHPITSELGGQSPLGVLETLDGQVLLLGVGFESCTAFHLAEYRMPWFARRPNRCVVAGPDGPRWVEYQAAVLDDEPFDRLGKDLAAAHPEMVRTGRVGAAVAWLFPIRAAVAFAASWLAEGGPPGGVTRRREGVDGRPER